MQFPRIERRNSPRSKGPPIVRDVHRHHVKHIWNIELIRRKIVRVVPSMPRNPALPGLGFPAEVLLLLFGDVVRLVAAILCPPFGKTRFVRHRAVPPRSLAAKPAAIRRPVDVAGRSIFRQEQRLDPLARPMLKPIAPLLARHMIEVNIERERLPQVRSAMMVNDARRIDLPHDRLSALRQLRIAIVRLADRPRHVAPPVDVVGIVLVGVSAQIVVHRVHHHRRVILRGAHVILSVTGVVLARLLL